MNDNMIIVEMGSADGDGNETIDLDKFFTDVGSVNDDMAVVEKLFNKLQVSNEEIKMVKNDNDMKNLRSEMDSDCMELVEVVKVIKGKMEALSKSNLKHQTTLAVNDLGKKLKIMMDNFQDLQAQIKDGYKDTIGRRYFSINGKKATDELIDNLISSVKNEDIIQKAIQDQGQGQIMDIITEIREKHHIIEMEKYLIELHQIFLDMSVLIETRGQVSDIDSDVARTSSSARLGTEQVGRDNVVYPEELQKRSKICTWITVTLVLIVVLSIMFFFLWLPKILNID